MRTSIADTYVFLFRVRIVVMLAYIWRDTIAICGCADLLMVHIHYVAKFEAIARYADVISEEALGNIESAIGESGICLS